MTRNLLTSTDGINITYVGAPIHDGSPRQDVADALTAARTQSVQSVRVALVKALTAQLNNFPAVDGESADSPRITSATAVLTEGDQVTNVSFPQWGPATVISVQTTDDGTVYVAARYLYSGETFSGTQQAYAYATCDHGQRISVDQCTACDGPADADVLPILDPEDNDYRTWTFAGSEGATETVSSSDRHLVVETSRSGYDGYRSTVLVFVQHTPSDAFPAGTHDNTDRNGPTRVLVPVGTDPRDAHADYLRDELGRMLATRWVTGQPEPTEI